MATNALNRLEPAYFIVDITGAVDNLSPEQFGTLPTLNAQSTAIEETNMMYEAVVRGAGTDIQPLQTSAISTTGRTATVPATAIQFTLVYDRPEFLYTEDEDNLGTFLTGVDAVKRYVARGIVFDIVENRQVYQPEDDKNEPQILEVTATKLYADVSTAEGNITVTEVADLVD